VCSSDLQTALWGTPHNRKFLIDIKETRNKIVPGVKAFSPDLVREFIMSIKKLRRTAELKRS
jgi:hypothetical protein